MWFDIWAIFPGSLFTVFFLSPSRFFSILKVNDIDIYSFSSSYLLYIDRQYHFYIFFIIPIVARTEFIQEHNKANSDSE